MCGIAGIFAYESNAAQVDREELLRVQSSMLSRGPDGEGVWISERNEIGLAHRRLSIIDLSAVASQPMSIEDGRYRIVFYGEIYNYQSLMHELKAKGCRFHSTSDTEVLLHLYAEYGEDMIHSLRGMFAFAIWDEVKRGLFLARDHFGIKPLYFHDDGHTFRIASQVKALLAGGGFAREIEPAGHTGFFLWGSVPEPFTLYRNLFSLPAGHTLWVDENGARAPSRYFDISEELHKASSIPLNDVSVHETLQSALRDSTHHHLVADVPVGVFLSSGIDSGTIMALASESSPHLNAVTLGFGEYQGTAKDETPLARILAERYGCRHHVARITRDDFDGELTRIFASMDQPTIDGINTYFVARAAAQAGLKVVLSGLGGDELFGGYPGFRQIPKLVSLARISAAIPGLGRVMRKVSAPMLTHLTSPKYAGVFEYGGSYAGAYLLRRSLFMPWELPQILDPDVVHEGWETLQPVLRMDDWVGNLSTSHARISALEFACYLRNTLLRDSDWAGMAHSLEIRTPLVDVDLFRALAPYLASARNLPSKQDMAHTPTKPLPDEVVNRPKTGFSIPVQEWIEAAGMSKRVRGLRGWALRVHDAFGTPMSDRRDHRKRILALVSDAFGAYGGIAKFNRDLLTATSASPQVAGVAAVTRVQPGPLEGLPINLFYDTRGISRNLRSIKGKLNYMREVFRILRHFRQVDLVLCGLINLLPIAYLAARIKRAPLWFVIYGIDAWQPHKNPIINWIVQHAEGVFAISEITKQRFSEWSGIPSDRVYLLPNCFDPILYGVGPKSAALLDRYGLNGKTVLLTLGRLSADEQYKGFDEVIESLPALAQEIPDIAYLIVGDGDDKERLQDKAKKIGVADRVVFAGFIPEFEKADHYRLADAYVMPGRGEGFGFVYLEAMACGIPTVASKLDGSRDALRNGQLGILADPTNLDDIQRAILQAVAQGRGRVPEGLEYFNIGAYRQRILRYVDQVFFPDGDSL